MYEVVWTDIADESYQEILDFILERWNIEIVVRLDDEVEKLIEKLSKHKHLCPELASSKIRKCVVLKYTSLFYEIDEFNRCIYLVNFFDNRSDHPY